MKLIFQFYRIHCTLQFLDKVKCTLGMMSIVGELYFKAQCSVTPINLWNKILSGCESSESSSSGSASGSDSEKSDKSVAPAQSDSIQSKSPNHSTETKSRRKSDSSREWDENPDIYGIRRSARSRKEPDRLTTQSNNESDGRKKVKKR